MYAQCEEFFRATISAFESASATKAEGKPFDPSKSIRKVVEGGKSVLGERGIVTEALPYAKRGWDWRRGARLMRGNGKAVSGETVLRILRLGLAREVGRCGF